MKKSIAVILCLAMLACFGVSASAANRDEIISGISQEYFQGDVPSIDKIATLINSSLSELCGSSETIDQLLDSLIPYVASSILYLDALTKDEPISLGTRELIQGNRGTDVVELQERLHLLGFYSDFIDGDFGKVTKDAVLDFQSVMGLDVTGFVDSSTSELIIYFSNAAPHDSNSTINYTDAKTMLESRIDDYCSLYETLIDLKKNDTHEFGSRELKIGDHGRDVLMLQAFLMRYGYYCYNLDGQFGDKTETALKVFQSVAGLECSGKADKDLIAKIPQILSEDRNGKDDAEKATIYFLLRENLEATLSLLAIADRDEHKFGDRQLSLGTVGTDVFSLQHILKTLGYYSGNMDGYFGPKTEAALKALQAYNKLEQTGILDTDTVKTIERLNSQVDLDETPKLITKLTNDHRDALQMLLAEAEKDVVPLGSRELKTGISGIDVANLQYLLKALGIYDDIIDGEFGEITEAAVKAFQNKAGLEETGVFDSDTCAAFFTTVWTEYQNAISLTKLISNIGGGSYFYSTLMPATYTVSNFIDKVTKQALK